MHSCVAFRCWRELFVEVIVWCYTVIDFSIKTKFSTSFRRIKEKGHKFIKSSVTLLSFVVNKSELYRLCFCLIKKKF